MLRSSYLIALILALVGTAARQPAFADPPEPLAVPDDSSETDYAKPGQIQPSNPHPFASLPTDDDAGAESPDAECGTTEGESYFSKLKWLGLRHSSTCGRNAGMGIPLVSSSWLNRPYYFGGDIGTVWLTRPINNNLSNDIDVFGGVFAGWDWDYYWGTELAIHRATPEIINENAPHADRGDSLMQETISMMYYPWGDTLFRPYWRWGIGVTQIDYPTDQGHRRNEALWTFPIGVGLEYPVRRWLAARAEFADQLALGNSGVATQHDLTLTFGLEWRFGARPKSYWPWNPSRHIW